MNHPRRHLFTLAAAATLALLCGTVSAQAWPSKPITIVNGYPAGGDSDAMARLYAEKLTAKFGQQVIVDNKPGASGTIAAAAVAKEGIGGRIVAQPTAKTRHERRNRGKEHKTSGLDRTPLHLLCQ